MHRPSRRCEFQVSEGGVGDAGTGGARRGGRGPRRRSRASASDRGGHGATAGAGLDRRGPGVKVRTCCEFQVSEGGVGDAGTEQPRDQTPVDHSPTLWTSVVTPCHRVGPGLAHRHRPGPTRWQGITTEVQRVGEWSTRVWSRGYYWSRPRSYGARIRRTSWSLPATREMLLMRHICLRRRLFFFHCSFRVWY